MKIALMSGAYVNAGDFLIEERTKSLLEKFIPNAEIDIYRRDFIYDDKIDELNSKDLIVFGGGPGFQRGLYPNRMPFVSDLSRLKIPYRIMGWGWKGSTPLNRTLYFKPLDDVMLRFVQGAKGIIGCRDWYTVHYLKNQGITNTMMTGCPAWFDLEYIDTLKPQKPDFSARKLRICVSDPAFKKNIKRYIELLMVIREKYPQAKIKLIVHSIERDWYRKQITEDWITRNHFEKRHISGTSEGFSVYDECDLHIGFRVHAHIYCLSHGKPSILLNEDARGNGVNDALGLVNINVWKEFKYVSMRGENFMREELENYIEMLEETEGLQFQTGCDRIKFFYNQMERYINSYRMV